MKLKNLQSSAILFLLPSLAITAAVSDTPLNKDTVSTTDILASGRGLGTKDAPIDGKDGRPHAGPFVELNVPSSKADELPPLPSRPADPTIVDGKKIPDIHDGVMVDKAHAGPKKGTTGLEGGVTEKSREKILREQQGEIVENKPQTPKEAPPLEHSDHEKIAGGKGSKAADKSSEKTVEDVLGLEVREFLELIWEIGTDTDIRNQPIFQKKPTINPFLSPNLLLISIISQSRIL